MLLKHIVGVKISNLTRVSEVRTSVDLSSAKVYFNVLESNPQKREKELLEIRAHIGKIRSLAFKKANLKSFPSLEFKLDESAINYSTIDTILDKIKKK